MIQYAIVTTITIIITITNITMIETMKQMSVLIYATNGVQTIK